MIVKWDQLSRCLSKVITFVKQLYSECIYEAISRYPGTKTSLFCRRWSYTVYLVERRLPGLRCFSETTYLSQNHRLKIWEFHGFSKFFTENFPLKSCGTRVRGHVSPGTPRLFQVITDMNTTFLEMSLRKKDFWGHLNAHFALFRAVG